MSVLTPEFLKLVPGFFATEIEESVRSLESLLRMCFVRAQSAADLFLMLGYNLSVPPYVRQALFSRSFNNDELLSSIRKPVLITHGADDAIVKPAIVDQHKARVAHAQIHVMENAGHAPFWDDATGLVAPRRRSVRAPPYRQSRVPVLKCSRLHVRGAPTDN